MNETSFISFPLPSFKSISGISLSILFFIREQVCKAQVTIKFPQLPNNNPLNLLIDLSCKSCRITRLAAIWNGEQEQRNQETS
ncbi:hypothetical protein K1719_001656 [Acacia pycnantha]|nr:hypothetical protein K1719_001656 [Acacia pycnantha]